MTTTIKLKSEIATINFRKSIENAKLNGIITKDDSIGSTILKDYEDWANDINNNPKSHQSHLAPTTTDKLIQMFQGSDPINSVQIDCYFGRTSEKAMRFVLEQSLAQKEDIEQIIGGRTLYERAEGEDKSHFLSLQSLNDCNFVKTPNPNRKGSEDWPTSGIYSSECRFDGGKVNFIFGNVNSIQYLRDDKYIDHFDNEPYVNEQGEKFLLVPLLPFGSEEKILNSVACNLGNYTNSSVVRILSNIYKSGFDFNEIQDIIADTSRFGISDKDAFGLLFDAIKHCQALNTDAKLKDIKIAKCKRTKHVIVSYPSYFLGSHQFQFMMELALSCIKHRKLEGHQFVKTGLDLKPMEQLLAA